MHKELETTLPSTVRGNPKSHSLAASSFYSFQLEKETKGTPSLVQAPFLYVLLMQGKAGPQNLLQALHNKYTEQE